MAVHKKKSVSCPPGGENKGDPGGISPRIITDNMYSDCVRIFQGARFALHLSFLCATLDLRCAFYCITLLRNLSMDAQITHLYQ